MLIYPAIDLHDGRAVRLHQGSFEEITVYGGPLEFAQGFAAQGAEWIHMVDLQGALAGRPLHVSIAEQVSRLELNLQWGGGIRTREHCEALFEAGATRLVLGSTLLKQPEEARAIIAAYGPRIAAGIDMREGMAAVTGWVEQTQTSGLELARQLADEGVGCVIATDIARDGAMRGPNLALMSEFAQELPVPVIASGGVSRREDIAALAQTGVAGAIIGKALYEGAFGLADAIYDASSAASAP